MSDLSFTESLDQIASLVKHFGANRLAYLAPIVKEAHIRQSLIDPLRHSGAQSALVDLAHKRDIARALFAGVIVGTDRRQAASVIPHRTLDAQFAMQGLRRKANGHRHWLRRVQDRIDYYRQNATCLIGATIRLSGYGEVQQIDYFAE